MNVWLRRYRFLFRPLSIGQSSWPEYTLSLANAGTGLALDSRMDMAYSVSETRIGGRIESSTYGCMASRLMGGNSTTSVIRKMPHASGGEIADTADASILTIWSQRRRKRTSYAELAFQRATLVRRTVFAVTRSMMRIPTGTQLQQGGKGAVAANVEMLQSSVNAQAWFPTSTKRTVITVTHFPETTSSSLRLAIGLASGLVGNATVLPIWPTLNEKGSRR